MTDFVVCKTHKEPLRLAKKLCNPPLLGRRVKRLMPTLTFYSFFKQLMPTLMCITNISDFNQQKPLRQTAFATSPWQESETT